MSATLALSTAAQDPKATIHGAARTELLRVDDRHAVAVGYDSYGDAVAVSRPFAANAEIEITLAAPESGSDVITILSGVSDAVPFLAGANADVVAHSKDTLTAIWYGVEHRVAAITIKSEKSFLDPLEIRPRPRAVTMAHAKLRDLPTLNVHLDTKSDIDNARVRLKHLDATTALSEREITNENKVSFASLQPAIYSVEVVLPEWTATTRADLTGGEDFDVTIKLEPIAITGHITQGEKPARARVALRYGRNVPNTETDENGHFALRVWTAGRYQFEVTPMEPVATEPHLDMLLITKDQTIDVNLPANRFSVQVVDGRAMKPIGGAHVSVSSARKSGRTMRNVRTSEEGVALLPPLYPGELVLRARADGYLESIPMTLQVPGAPEEISIALHREEETTSLSVILPNGTPAVDAEAIVMRDLLAPYAVLWQGRTDATGTVRIPTSMNGAYVAVRHASAAGTIRPWHAQSGAPWKLQPAADSLVLRARDRSGDPLLTTRVTTWIDGVRVSGYMLQFLAWSNDTTDGRGIWIGRRLPATPLRALIGNTTVAHDALATQIAYPWNGPQTLTGID